MSSKGKRKGKRQPKPRPRQTVQAVTTPRTPHPVRTALKVLSLLIAAGVLVYLAAAWGSIPDQVPSSFDAAGQPAAYTEKTGLLLSPVVAALLALLVAAVINDNRVWRFPFKVRDDARLEASAVMNNMMVLLALEIQVIFALLTLSMALSWNPPSLVMSGLTAAFIITVVGGNLLCWARYGRHTGGSGGTGTPPPSGGGFDAPPNSLGRRY